MIKAVIFDFDGVICQTETYKIDRLTEYLRGIGLTVNARELYVMAGGTHIEREIEFDRLFENQELYWKVKDQALAFRMNLRNYGMLRTDEVLETLEQLKSRGMLLGMASNSPMDRLIQAMDECGVTAYFDEIGSAFTERRKPDPYIYQYLMDKLNVTSEECVVVEDSAMGIRSGKSAGARVLALRDRDGAIDQSEADVVILKLHQVLDYI